MQFTSINNPLINLSLTSSKQNIDNLKSKLHKLIYFKFKSLTNI